MKKVISKAAFKAKHTVSYIFDDYRKTIIRDKEDKFKFDLKIAMESEIRHPACGCELCEEAISEYIKDSESWLEKRWQQCIKK